MRPVKANYVGIRIICRETEIDFFTEIPNGLFLITGGYRCG